MEQLDLTAPVPAAGGTSVWKVQEMHFTYVEAFANGGEVRVLVVGQNDERRTLAWSGALASTLIAALNTANLSVKSLHRRILERAVADGKLGAGTYSGAPDS